MKVAAIVKELQVTQQNKMETRIRLNRLFLTKTDEEEGEEEEEAAHLLLHLAEASETLAR